MTGSIARKTSIAPILRSILVYSVLLILIPLVLYPNGYGFPALDLNPAFGLLEWAFYVAVLSISAARLPFATRVVAAGFTVIFRLALGAASGLLIGWMRTIGPANPIVETMWSYPMAVIPQVLAAAVITRSLWEHLMSVPYERRKSTNTVRTRPTFMTTAISSSAATAPKASASRVASTSNALTHEPSFDDAVSYVGEYSGVRLCWIVDSDGLPIAVWQRQMYTGDADFWAPVSVEMVDFHKRRLSFGGDVCQPDRLDIRTNQGRLVVEAVRNVWLGVLTDTDADDLISVRITRARDMIAKHLHAESAPTVAAGEVQYV